MDVMSKDSRSTAENAITGDTLQPTPGELSPRPFADRHIGPSDEQIRAILDTLGLDSLDALIDETLPAGIRTRAPLDLPPGIGEAEVLAELRETAAANRVYKSFIGLGYYGTHLPPVIQRNVLESPAWYTAYTPYQPEISQGRLEALFVFQTLVSDLTGLPVANASLLDEATAAAEAMTLCRRVSKSESLRFFVSREAFPQTIEVLRTRARPLGYELVIGDHARDLEGLDCFGALLQYPGASGDVHDYRDAIRRVHERGGLAVTAADLLALTLLTPPGELGADVAVGSTQRFGVPLGFGGPHAAYISTRADLTRQLPGRLVGLSVDRRGEPAYRLAIQTREQHIRREKATSNICTAQVLLAVIAAFYACYHGPHGLRRIARHVHRLTAALAEGLREMGFALDNETAFDTLTVAVGGGGAERVLAAARAQHMNLRVVDAGRVGLSLDEITTAADVEALWQVFTAARHALEKKGVRPHFSAAAADERSAPGHDGADAGHDRPASLRVPAFAEIEPRAPDLLPSALARRSSYLTHPVFNRYDSETEMLRYIRRLADKDLALDRTMIPLGSCTMKLNAAAEMLPISWPGFNAIHPFAPNEQTEGYRRLTAELERMLCACTGYAAVSLQPNAGSQGEYAALLAIRAYHESRGEGQRNVCLIPSSAHGTNPASANLAGLTVVVVACDADGNVDVADLRAKTARHASRLAAFMLTYPSTHGVFESAVRELCDVVHEAGGQVFIDGANLNAMVGLAKLAEIGGDASHLNLHKTFCIPHGGGGPGVGPVAVKAHLAPFLPGPAIADSGGSGAEDPLGGKAAGSFGGGAVSAAPYGSASILPISWAYIRLMGGTGLRKATQVAILNANYVARRLAPHYPVLYTGQNGRVAHECVLDLRPIKQRTGITVDDVAKRLIDFGFHAPTISFPVAGTLMIEPTESESLEELDRFCDAMIRIRAEIEAIAAGTFPPTDNPLVNAPHTAIDLVDEWQRAYPREQAVFPLPALRHAKYWPPIGRIDNAYGDRHLVCTCPPMEAYASEDACGDKP